MSEHKDNPRQLVTGTTGTGTFTPPEIATTVLGKVGNKALSLTCFSVARYTKGFKNVIYRIIRL